MTTLIATENTYRRIYRCTNKACKHVFAYDYTKVCTNYFERDIARAEELGRRYVFTYEYVRTDANGEIVNRQKDSHCPLCQKFADFDDVKAVKGEHKCGARCTNAKGGDCDCQCNGKNHGTNHL